MLKPIDKSLSVPRHEQVQDLLRDLIRSGALVPNQKLPADTELAERFGVSKMTAHRALQELAVGGWVTRSVGKGTFVAPAPAARSLRRAILAFGSAATNIFGSDYYGSLYRGIADTFGDGVEIALCPEALSASHLPAADGVIVLGPRESTLAEVQALLRVKRPTILVGGHWDGVDLPAVDCDNAAASGRVVAHLASAGHRRVVLVFAEPETANTRDRREGFHQAASERGLTVIECEAREFWRLQPDEKKQLTGALIGQNPATAVFAAGYFLALDVMNVLREARLAVPEDISLVGFDDPVSAQLIYPPLTTVRQPLYEMGRRAAERLRSLVESRTDDGGVDLLPAQLIVRASTSTRKGFRQ